MAITLPSTFNKYLISPNSSGKDPPPDTVMRTRGSCLKDSIMRPERSTFLRTYRAYNQYSWDVTERRVLYKMFEFPYAWSDLDNAVHLFDESYYKEMNIQFRDTPDNVEKFLEDPHVFVKNVHQMPLSDVFGAPPCGLSWGQDSNVRTVIDYETDGVIGILNQYHNGPRANWVNSIFVKQSFDFVNEPAMYSNIDEDTSISIWKNPVTTRSEFPLEKNLHPQNTYEDIMNPDERIYEITFKINSEYYVTTSILEYKIFDLIARMYSGQRRSFITCQQFIEVLEELDRVNDSGYYRMRRHNLIRQAQDFTKKDLSKYFHEDDRSMLEICE